jgi:hypothetical protein
MAEEPNKLDPGGLSPSGTSAAPGEPTPAFDPAPTPDTPVGPTEPKELPDFKLTVGYRHGDPAPGTHMSVTPEDAPGVVSRNLESGDGSTESSGEASQE